MLKLKNIAQVISGLPLRKLDTGSSRVVRLSDLSDFRAGQEPRLATGEIPPVARAQCISRGDLIVGARGTDTEVCGAADAFIGAYISLDVYLVRPNPSLVDSRYLASFLKSPPTQVLLTSGKQGTGLPRLPKEALEETEVPLPPLQTQHLIADLTESFEREAWLLRRLASLSESVGRTAVIRAIRAANTGLDFSRSAQ